MDDANQMQVLWRLARAVAEAAPDSPLSLRLCRACSAILDVQGGSLTLAYQDPGRMTLCTTDDQAAQLEDLQEVLGDGPSFTASREDDLVVASFNGSGDARWPHFGEAAKHALGGPCTVIAVPISPHRRVIGVATFFRRSVDPRLAVSDAAVRLLLNAVGVALVQGVDAADEARQARAESWTDRARINQAVGMVMAQLRVRSDDAMALLRAHAYAHALPLAVTSGQVIDRRLDFKVADSGPPNRTVDHDEHRPDGLDHHQDGEER